MIQEPNGCVYSQHVLHHRALCLYIDRVCGQLKGACGQLKYVGVVLLLRSENNFWDGDVFKWWSARFRGRVAVFPTFGISSNLLRYGECEMSALGCGECNTSCG